MIIDPYRYSRIADFNALDIFDVYGLFKSSIAVQSDFMIIKRSDGVGDKYTVDWDSSDEWSDASPVTIYGGASAGTFADIKSSHDWSITAFIGHVTGNEIYANNSVDSVGQAKIAVGGTIVTDPENGKPAVLFLGDRGFNNHALGGYSELAYNQNWSIGVTCNPTNDGAQHGLFSSNRTGGSGAYYDIHLDRRANKTGADILNPTGSTTLDYLAVQSTAVQKRILVTNSSSQDGVLYLNNVSQDSANYGATAYTNDNFRIGDGQNQAATPLDGYWQLMTCHDAVLTTAQRAKLDNQLIKIFT